jgi:hypothetical protein
LSDTERRKVFRPEVAERAGISDSSARRYLELARAHRRYAKEVAAAEAAGTPIADVDPKRLPQPGDMPEPDDYDYPPDRKLSGERATRDPAAEPRHSGSKSPWWWEDRIQPWTESRRSPGKPRADGTVPARADPEPRPRRRAPEPAATADARRSA